MSLIAQNNATGTLSADGQTTGVKFSGGDVHVASSGTFGGGTLSLQASFDNGTTYVTVPNSGVTSASVFVAYLPDCLVRLSLSGATTPSITYWLTQRVPV